jgi:hypothetical protein
MFISVPALALAPTDDERARNLAAASTVVIPPPALPLPEPLQRADCGIWCVESERANEPAGRPSAGRCEARIVLDAKSAVSKLDFAKQLR